jgi:hypothetical protein
MRVGDTIVPAAAFHEATADAQVATSLTARMMTLVAADLRRWLDAGLSIGGQKGPPIGVQKRPPSSGSATVMTDAPFALVAA